MTLRMYKYTEVASIISIVRICDDKKSLDKNIINYAGYLDYL